MLFVWCPRRILTGVARDSKLLFSSLFPPYFSLFLFFFPLLLVLEDERFFPRNAFFSIRVRFGTGLTIENSLDALWKKALCVCRLFLYFVCAPRVALRIPRHSFYLVREPDWKRVARLANRSRFLSIRESSNTFPLVVGKEE